MTHNVLIYSTWIKGHINWLNGFVNYFIKVGCKVFLSEETDENKFHSILTKNKINYVYVWNGEYGIAAILKETCESLNITYSILECGIFPQNKYFIIGSFYLG